MMLVHLRQLLLDLDLAFGLALAFDDFLLNRHILAVDIVQRVGCSLPQQLMRQLALAGRRELAL